MTGLTDFTTNRGQCQQIQSGHGFQFMCNKRSYFVIVFFYFFVRNFFDCKAAGDKEPQPPLAPKMELQQNSSFEHLIVICLVLQLKGIYLTFEALINYRIVTKFLLKFVPKTEATSARRYLITLPK